MPRSYKSLAANLSVEELRQLLAVKEKLTTLEVQQAKLKKELAKVEVAIAKLMSTPKKPGRRKKPGRPKKTAGKRKVAVKATRKVAKKTARKVATRKAASGKKTVEQVVADLIQKNGSPMKFQDILSVITKRKLVKSKSKNFSNVLRRTLSTSGILVRKGRGIYGLK